MATATARAVEASLALVLQERDARLRARYGDRVAPAPAAALVTPSGRPITGLPPELGRGRTAGRSRPAAAR